MVIDFPRQITLNKNNKNVLFQNKTFDKIAEIKYHIWPLTTTKSKDNTN